MRIDPELCTACARCVRYCPVDCIREKGEVFAIDEDACVECGVCLRDAGCPTDAIFMPQESREYPRSVRAAFSDPAVQFPELKQGGRGTEEMKTNDVTGKFGRGEYGMTLEFGRPGVGTRLGEVEKVTRFLSTLNVHLEEANALNLFMEDTARGILKPEVRDQEVLSVILELKLRDDQLETVVTDLMPVLATLDTVVSWGLVARFDAEGRLPVIDRLERLGLPVRPNAKINVGLGRPLAGD